MTLPSHTKTITAAAASVLAALALAGCHRAAPGAAASATTASAAVPVSVLTAQISTMQKTLPVVGQLQTDNQVNLTTKIAGKVTALLVTTGDRVSAGQLVAQLDPSDALSQLQNAQSGLDAARARYDQARSGVSLKDAQTASAIQAARSNLSSAQQNLSQIREGARTQERAQAELGVQRAEADLNHAALNYNRMQTLYNEGAISQQQRDDARYSLQVYQTALTNARQQSSLVLAGSRSQQILMAEDQVRQMQAQLAAAEAGTAQYAMTRQDVQAAAAAVGQASSQVQLARQQLESTKIYSPVSGIVDTRPATIGSSVAPTTVLMTIVPTRGVYFEAEVPEQAISSVRLGEPVSTTVDALPGRTFTGQISEIIPVAAASTKLYRVHISIPNGAGMLPNGGFARGQITTSQISGIIIPKDALSSTVGDFYVWVVQDNIAHRRSVTVGLSDDVRSQILSGLKPGDVYVVSGKDSVTEGAAVTVKADARVA